MSSCIRARSSASPACSCRAPSRCSVESPSMSPAAFFERPISLSRSPILALLSRFNRATYPELSFKRQSRRTRRSLGSDATDSTAAAGGPSSGARDEKRARSGLFTSLRYHRPRMAKKPRTPTPPRPVQVPKRREAPKQRPSVSSVDRSLLYWIGGGVVGIGIIVGLWLGLSGGGGGAPKPVDFATLPG